MTKPEAKAVMTEVWGYLAEHPECERKEDLPPDLYDKIKVCFRLCPLCEVYRKPVIRCINCVLFKKDTMCGSYASLYSQWKYAPSGEAGNAIRAASAKEILEISEAWDTEEE
jgi:hypothetical protein